MRRGRIAAVSAAVAALALPASAFSHAERKAYYPNFEIGSGFQDPFGEVPEYRNSGPKLVVCKDNSRRLIRKLSGKLRKRNLRLLKDCEFEHIQEAVNAAENGTRILVLPGVYREQPSAEAPDDPQECKDDKEESANGQEQVPSYKYHYECPNAQNLIAITGDDPDDEDRECDEKCDIQIEGTGRRKDVLIQGNQTKLNVIRADRADGIYLRNFTIELSDFNNIYALETNGFTFDGIESRYSREYGFLSFASDNGLYTNLEAFGSGDSGIYPGSGPEGHCDRYGIEIRNSESHHNNLGYSGTAGNGVWAHDNKFHHNGTGIVTDSFAAGHPGMPQDCAKWEDNQIYSNNLELFSDERDEYCKQDYEDRDPKIVCPTFQNPVGTGVLIAGGNSNIVRNNFIWDNWRQGIALFFVPEELRGEDPTGQSENNNNQVDTSNFNTFSSNRMGVTPGGKYDPNGLDLWWDEQGESNCWEGHRTARNEDLTTDPPEPVWSLKASCPGSTTTLPPSPDKSGFLVPCATWDPQDNTDPPGCRMAGYSWFEQPPEPDE